MNKIWATSKMNRKSLETFLIRYHYKRAVSLNAKIAMNEDYVINNLLDLNHIEKCKNLS